MSDVVIYDPADPIVAGRVTEYLPSVHTPDYSGDPNTLINPDLSALSAVAQIYWKESTGTIVEMSAGEKTSIDDDLAVVSEAACRATRTTNQTISDITSTDVTFPTEDYDVGDMHDLVTNTDRITIPTGAGGRYAITGGAIFAAVSTGRRRVSITINGSLENTADQMDLDANASGPWGMCVARMANLSAGDIVRLAVWQSSGASLNVSAARIEVTKLN